jgi:hypothetical protein
LHMNKKCFVLIFFATYLSLVTFAQAASNLVKNNGFENLHSDWILKSGNESITSVEKHSGTYAVFDPAGKKCDYRQRIELVPGKNI